MMGLGEIANLLSRKANVVGTVGTLRGLRAAARLKPGIVDFIEVRVDALASQTEQAVAALRAVTIPLIITVRHHSEGGKQVLSAAERRALFTAFLPRAAFIDVELRFARSLQPVLQDAAAAGVGLIVSYHNFTATPTLNRLRQLAEQSRRWRPAVFKVATVTNTPQDVATLLSLLAGEKRLPLSVMGMGTLGKVSRLLFAQAGSVLNYGYIDEPQAGGQWRATLLRQKIDELVTEG